MYELVLQAEMQLFRKSYLFRKSFLLEVVVLVAQAPVQFAQLRLYLDCHLPLQFHRLHLHLSGRLLSILEGLD